MLGIIKKSLTKYQDEIMRFTLGSDIDEYDEKYADVYKTEWYSRKESIARTIETIYYSSLPLNPDMIVGLFIGEWFNCISCDLEDLNYYGLLGVAISVIRNIEEVRGVK